MTPGAIRARARRARERESSAKGLSPKPTSTTATATATVSSTAATTATAAATATATSSLTSKVHPATTSSDNQDMDDNVHILSKLAARCGLDVESNPPSVKVVVNAPFKKRDKKEQLTTRKNTSTSTATTSTPHEFLKSSNPPSVQLLTGKDCLIASCLPPNFDIKLTYRALAAYSLLRSLSIPLRLAPFTPSVFLRGLAIPCQNKLIGTIHVHMLRFLFAQHNLGVYHHRGDGAPKRSSSLNESAAVVEQYLARREKSNDMFRRFGLSNITYLDCQTWPLYYDDFVHMTLKPIDTAAAVV